MEATDSIGVGYVNSSALRRCKFLAQYASPPWVLRASIEMALQRFYIGLGLRHHFDYPKTH
jgi:hypothetical protein